MKYIEAVKTDNVKSPCFESQRWQRGRVFKGLGSLATWVQNTEKNRNLKESPTQQNRCNKMLQARFDWAFSCGNSKLPSTPHSTGLSRIQHLKMIILNPSQGQAIVSLSKKLCTGWFQEQIQECAYKHIASYTLSN